MPVKRVQQLAAAGKLTDRRSLHACCVAGIAITFVAFALMAGTANAEETLSPWWHLSTSSRPSYLAPGKARDEVQRIKAGRIESAGVGLFGGAAGTRDKEQSAQVGGDPEEAQKALEGLYGAGNVEVTGAPPFEEYEVKFVGELADQPVGLMGGATRVLAGRPDGEIFVGATNLGDEVVNPETHPVTITDRLPKGLVPVGITGAVGQTLKYAELGECSLKTVSCTFATQPAKGQPNVQAAHQLQMLIAVDLKPGASSGEVNEASIVGGGAPPETARSALTVSGAPVPSGVNTYEIRPEEVGGKLDTQAGSHPFQLTTTLNFNETFEERILPEIFTSAGGSLPFINRPAGGSAKDLSFNLPAGLIGNPQAIPTCPLQAFLELAYRPNRTCPPDTVVGFAVPNVLVEGGAILYEGSIQDSLYNVEPAPGEPARFGFVVYGDPVLLDTSVRTGSDYAVRVNVTNITQTVEFIGNEITIWGVPGDPRHDGQRCYYGAGGESSCSASVKQPPPFLSLPTSCSGPLHTSMQGDLWNDPKHLFGPVFNTAPMVALDGCNRLSFSSEISVAPDVQEGSTPTGLSVGIHVPQESTLDPEGLAESALRDTTVTLPVGVQISPAAADGLLACSDEEVGFTGVEASSGTNLFTPGPVGCPNASKVGTVEVKTPLLPEPLVGAVYLAAQNANPFGSLIGLYIEVEAPVSGVRVKLAGEIKLDESTGQIVTVFPNNPKVPVEEAKLHFFGGARAPLSTPSSCGSYTSTSSIVPWSGNEASKSSSTFDITSGPNGGPCASPRPFQPGFNAGTTSVQAGGYSPLTMTLSRPDADQQLGKLSVVFPPGISAGLRGVRLCEEPQAATGDCPAESQIGTVTVSAGLGGDPFPVETGKAYITGPYEGDPFGVDVVVPAVAGPFNLGTEVVRSKVDVDPTDAHLTVVSDAFPTMLDGIPLQLQHINVNVNRPGFVFNPTSCEPMKLTGVLGSSEGATADVSTPFQVTNCAALSFKPEFAVSTSAKTSRTEGASLHVTLTLPNTPRGTGANVAKVKVSLPKQLPSPLKTLQKACTERVFAENPSNCPVASRVGEAKVETPVLEGPLSGPAYFVSHGGAKYPELIIVLTGEDGVTVQVHGETFISKQGITTATFGTVPDVPFSNFELELPEREYPALTANGNLCKGTLIMPTEMVGQNGLKINQETKISVTGCSKTKKASHKKKAKGKKKHRAGRKRSG